ncbi:MAG TPA: SCO family protein [Candidatus Udaeobacter sp.]|jgi:protein SCO1/2|nr:SCO family protein [Candidatus Udaeobacter sp.]
MKSFALALMFVCAIDGQTRALTPGDLARVTFQQHPGLQVSPDLVFRDQDNRLFRFGDHFGKQPTVLVLGYYRCPMLCSLINDGLIHALQELPLSVGKDFQLIDVSIDPEETPASAAAKRSEYLREYGHPKGSNGWHFLVGDQRAITRLADQTGFRYVYDPQTRQYAHPSGAIVLTPEGKISRYVFGVRLNARELRDALVAAKEGKSSSSVSQLFLLCYHYNPITGKYGPLILSVLRIAGLGFLAAIFWFVFSMAHRSTGGPA